MTLPQAIENALVIAAGNVGVSVDWLKVQIAAESAWNPAAYNDSTGATGLIQFVPRTMEDYGFLSAPLAAEIRSITTRLPESIKERARQEFLSKWPTAEAQLMGPVISYYRRYRPYPTEQSFYLATFYPAYRFMNPDTTFPDSVRLVNPGINKISDYIAFVKKKVKAPAFWARVLARLRRSP